MARPEVTPHFCPAAPDGWFGRVTVEDLRRIGCSDEADRLAEVVRSAKLWGVEAQENAAALGYFGCCRHAELAVAIRDHSETSR